MIFFRLGSKIVCLISLTLTLSHCGVKGKPLTPLEAPPIGRGKPTLRGGSAKAKELRTTDLSKAQSATEPSQERK